MSDPLDEFLALPQRLAEAASSPVDPDAPALTSEVLRAAAARLVAHGPDAHWADDVRLQPDPEIRDRLRNGAWFRDHQAAAEIDRRARPFLDQAMRAAAGSCQQALDQAIRDAVPDITAEPALRDALARIGPKLHKPELLGYQREMRHPPDTSWIQMETEGGRISWLPRWMHRLYARIAGYFWLPCPLCRTPFGGHECRDIDGKSSSIRDPLRMWVRLVICPACTRTGRGR